MINSMIVTPTCMLGGCFWPLAIMPEFMQKIANLHPAKWAIEAVEIAATGGIAIRYRTASGCSRLDGGHSARRRFCYPAAKRERSWARRINVCWIPWLLGKLSVIDHF